MLPAWDHYNSATRGFLILQGAQTILHAHWHILLHVHSMHYTLQTESYNFQNPYYESQHFHSTVKHIRNSTVKVKQTKKKVCHCGEKQRRIQ